jgi:hypothetical protein
MRRSVVAQVACVLVMLTLWPAFAQQTLDVPGRVDRAVRLLLSPDGTDASCIEGLVSLLDAIVAAAPAAGIGGTWPAKVITARERVAAGQMDQTAALLNDSYRAVHGRSFTIPAAVRSLPEAQTYIRNQLSSVRSLLDHGRAGEAVRRMLEAAVMVVTPLEG